MKNERALALLESSFIFILISTLLLGGLLLTEKFQQHGQASRIVDAAVHEQLLRPLSLEQRSGSYEIVVRHQALNEYLKQMADRTEKSIIFYLDRKNLDHDLFVEAAYGVIAVDPQNGSVSEQLESFSCEYRFAGALSGQQNCENLADTFLALSLEKHAKQYERSIFAIPLKKSTSQEQQDQYLPYAVIVGLRIGWRGNIGVFKELLQMSPVVVDKKVSVLRGEVEL